MLIGFSRSLEQKPARMPTAVRNKTNKNRAEEQPLARQQPGLLHSSALNYLLADTFLSRVLEAWIAPERPPDPGTLSLMQLEKSRSRFIAPLAAPFLILRMVLIPSSLRRTNRPIGRVIRRCCDELAGISATPLTIS
jgi:hypothetical protein